LPWFLAVIDAERGARNHRLAHVLEDLRIKGRLDSDQVYNPLDRRYERRPEPSPALLEPIRRVIKLVSCQPAENGRNRRGSLWLSRVLSVVRSLREREDCPSKGNVGFCWDKLPRSRSERATLRPQFQPSHAVSAHSVSWPVKSLA